MWTTDTPAHAGRGGAAGVRAFRQTGDHTVFKRHRNRPVRRPQRRNRPAVRLAGFEMLDERVMPAVTAMFSPTFGLLTVLGDTTDNTITVGRDAAGVILVNGGAVGIVGGTATVANTGLIAAFGLDGNDTIALDETNGALPAADLFGGGGNDVLTGGSGDDQIFGQSGNDILLGKGGNDLLFGGDGNDTLTGGVGTDQVFGLSGDDLLIWNPGEGSDLNEGGDGNDTVVVNGGNGAENFAITANGSRVRFDRVTPAPFTLDIGTTENVVLNANGGDDTITAGNGLATLTRLTLDGGAGNDTIQGGDGNDVLIGGDGNDFIDGGRGSDLALMGAGDDTFRWDPGDGSDTVEGQAGRDAMLFNGANVAERIDISANGQRVRFTRDVGNVVMDLNGVEGLDFDARGGADAVTVGDLTGTALARVGIDLSGTPSGGAGDGQADSVVVDGTNHADAITVAGNASGTSVLGLAAQVNITGAEANLDLLTVNALAGDDVVSASALSADAIQLTANGGDGNDVLIGGAGNDTLTGGNGDDVLIGGAGNDVLDGGPGNNVVIQ
jgi:Ca2+-binding RTX toxin-like protein